jgi:hypothetical protein
MSRFKIKFFILMSTLLAGLWLAACKTTPAPSTPVPPQPETSETKDNRQSTSAPPVKSAEPGAQESSQTRKATSPEATATQKPESKKKSGNHQTTSPDATQARPQEAAQRMPQERTKTPQTADAKLAKARDDLRVSQATEKRIADELEALKKSGNASDEDIRNYEAPTPGIHPAKKIPANHRKCRIKKFPKSKPRIRSRNWTASSVHH